MNKKISDTTRCSKSYNKGSHGHYSQMHGVSDTKSVYVQPGGHKKYRTLAATHPVAFVILTLNGAKVLLFFDMTKFSKKKMRFSATFCKKAAKTCYIT